MSRFRADVSPAGRPPTRRDWLRVGIPMAAAGLMPTASVGASGGRPRAKSVIVIYTGGGMSQLETWDPKPAAPVEIRGAFGTIPTAIPGVRFGEHLPRTARLADRFTVLRSMTHDDLDHGSACYLALTGQFHPRKSSNPPPRPTDYPALGAVLHRVRPSDRFPHSAFHVNGPLLAPREPSAGQYGGFLGRGYDPIELGEVTRGTALLDGLNPPADVSSGRFSGRRQLLSRLESAGRADVRFPATVPRHDVSRKAYELIDSPTVRSAFDLTGEPEAVRDRYGRYRGGQACLLARRLAEAGVPWTTVFFNHNIRGQDSHVGETDHYGWDTHNDIFQDLRDHLLPRFDRTFSALIEDLDQRGMLDDTLVVCMGEFGRAPVVAVEKNFAGRGAPGRKHWAGCYSVVLAGAGVGRGGVYGGSDRHAAYPADRPVSPGELAATMFHALGIDADTHYHDLNDRPVRMTTGEPVLGVFG